MSAQLFSKDGSFVKDLRDGCFFEATAEIFQTQPLKVIFYQENAHDKVLCLEEIFEDSYKISSIKLSDIVDTWVEDFFEDIEASYVEFASNLTVKIGDYQEVIDTQSVFSNHKDPKNEIQERIKKIITSYI